MEGDDALKKDRLDYEAALAEVRRLVRAHAPNEISLVDALLEERRAAAKIKHTKFLADERIPLEERQKWGMPLTAEEIQFLKDGGIDLDKEIDPDNDPILEGQRFLAKLLLESLTIGAAARRLGVPVAKIRAMSAKRQLYSVEFEYGLRRFPTFQFTTDGLVPGFDKVAPNIPFDRPLIGVARWFSLEDPDLFLDDEPYVAFTPRNWLMAKYDSTRIVERLRDWDVGL